MYIFSNSLHLSLYSVSFILLIPSFLSAKRAFIIFIGIHLSTAALMIFPDIFFYTHHHIRIRESFILCQGIIPIFNISTSTPRCMQTLCYTIIAYPWHRTPNLTCISQFSPCISICICFGRWISNSLSSIGNKKFFQAIFINIP